MDREKVIKGLENCLHYKGHCLDCPYNSPNCQNDVLNDALALLKEQEAVEPEKFMYGQVQRYKCRKCGKRLLYASFAKDNYCSKCGQAVKWE